jgi:hypothetical protein
MRGKSEMLPPGWGYRIVPDGRIDLRPVDAMRLASEMRLASVPRDAAAELESGHIIYVNSMALAEKIIALAGLRNWGLTAEEDAIVSEGDAPDGDGTEMAG